MRTIIASALVGLLIGGALVAVFVGWKLAAAAVAIDVVIALAGLAARAWRRGNHQADQIFDEEIGGPDPNKGLGPKDFAMDLRVEPAALLYDLTVGFHDGDDPSVYRGLTQGELANKLAEHEVSLPDNAIRGRHVRSADSRLITWQPSTTDTTGETR